MEGKFRTLVLILAFSGCAKQKEQSTIEVPVSTDSVASVNAEMEDECFNRKMEQWFTSFNRLQDEGASMAEADAKALAEAEIEFKKCKEDIEKLTSKARE